MKTIYKNIALGSTVALVGGAVATVVVKQQNKNHVERERLQ